MSLYESTLHSESADNDGECQTNISIAVILSDCETVFYVMTTKLCILISFQWWLVGRKIQIGNKEWEKNLKILNKSTDLNLLSVKIHNI